MRLPISAVLGGALTLAALAGLWVPTGIANADDSFAPPFIDHAAWDRYRGDLTTLRVYPTTAGRGAAGTLGTAQQGDEAWAEVLAAAPDADDPGMRAQFLCHWQLAEFAEPGKTSWNIEPWRPMVDASRMITTGCNPGGEEEPN